MPAQPLLQHSLKPGQDRAENQVDNPRLTVEHEGLELHGNDGPGRHHNLSHRDGGHQGGVLQQADKGVGQRRHRHQSRLGNDNAHHGLNLVQAQGVAGFKLPPGNGGKGSADNLGVIGTLADGQGHNGGGDGVQHQADGGQAEVNDIDLHQKGCATNHPHHKPGDGLEGRNFRHAHQGQEKCEHQSQRKGDQHERDGDQ